MKKKEKDNHNKVVTTLLFLSLQFCAVEATMISIVIIIGSGGAMVVMLKYRVLRVPLPSSSSLKLVSIVEYYKIVHIYTDRQTQ